MWKLEEIRQTLLNVIKSCESEEGNILFSF
jgi:hypothetical protein